MNELIIDQSINSAFFFGCASSFLSEVKQIKQGLQAFAFLESGKILKRKSKKPKTFERTGEKKPKTFQRIGGCTSSVRFNTT